MNNDRALGDHLGYLAYHVEALEQRHEELVNELKEIRDTVDDEDEQVAAERSALLEFRADVARRVAKLEEQAENSIEDAPETAHDRAMEIRESAISTHLEPDDPPDTDFQTATSFSDKE